MKHPFNLRILPWFSLGMGGIALCARSWLYAAGTDEKGLFLPSHPALILSFVLSALFLGALALCVLSAKNTGSYRELFPRSALCAAGNVIGGIGIIPTAASLLVSRENNIYLLCGIAGIFAAIALVLRAWCRWKGRKPSFYLQGIVTVFLLMFCICRYRSWSTEPQFGTYFFQLLACVLLMVYSYQCTAVDAGSGNLQMLTFTGQGALFFCLATLPDGDGFFFLTMALWCAAGTPSCAPATGGDDLEAS
ncbi:MAG: hypothetical protein J6A74_05305 [Oscillospiraceae bacterium]|nr:hypothetical protein [Oscillospiraceae bacterium]